MRAGFFLTLLLPALGQGWLQTGFCNYTKKLDYYDDVDGISCINPKSIGWTEFSWQPLFPGRVKFVYAADEINGTVWSQVDESGKTNADDVQNTTSSLVGFWLEYDKFSLNNTDSEMQTEMAVFYTDASTDVGGPHNGCEKVLGEECIQKINSTLTRWFRDYSWSDSYFPLYHLDNLSDVCPEILFSEKQVIGSRSQLIRDRYASYDIRLLALEQDPDSKSTDPEDVSQIMDSGNWSYTYSRQVHGRRPLAQQKGSVAVAILLRHPDISDDQLRKDVHMTTACAKLGSNASFSGDDNDQFYPTAGAYKALFASVPLVLTVIGLSVGVTVGVDLW